MAENTAVDSPLRGVEGAAGVATEDDGVGTGSVLAWPRRGLGLGRGSAVTG